jgi:thermitase
MSKPTDQMEIKLIHILGPVIATVAMLFYGQAMVGNAQGRRVRVGPALLLIVGAILFRQFTGDGTFLDRICLTLLDFGIALIIDSAYLSAKRYHPKVFWVPGVLALVVSFGLYFVASLFGWTVNSMFAEDKAYSGTKAQVLVELGADDDIAEVSGLLERYDATYQRVFADMTLEEDPDLFQYYLVELPEEEAAALIAALSADTENVDAAELNGAVTLLEPTVENILPTSDGPFYANDPGIRSQWWMQDTATSACFSLLAQLAPQRRAKIAIIDTGVEAQHEDLSGIFRKSPGDTDGNGHGTHCAGLAGAITNNGLGMASFNWEGRFIEISSYPALSSKGQGDHISLARAIRDAARDGADVISMSLGMQRKAPKILLEAADYAQKSHCILVAAAGNDYGNDAQLQSPANVPGVICVAAVNSRLEASPFSNFNTHLAMPIAAPGQEIYSTYPGGQYKELSGTSMATPIVAGLIGILRAYAPRISTEEVWRILHGTGTILKDSKDIGRLIAPFAAISLVTREIKRF